MLLRLVISIMDKLKPYHAPLELVLTLATSICNLLHRPQTIDFKGVTLNFGPNLPMNREIHTDKITDKEDQSRIEILLVNLLTTTETEDRPLL